MDGHTALLLMRAKRQQAEAEIAAPHKAEADRAMRVARDERDARKRLERLLQSELLPHILEQVGRNLGEGVHREIMKAVGSQKSFTGTTTLNLPTEMLLAADPKSVVGRVVDWWKLDVAPKMSIASAMDVADQTVQVMDIRLPAMGYREAIYDR